VNPWDKLSGSFNTHKRQSDIDSGAADNILIAWPAIFEGIRKVQRKGKGLTAFDFGCGTGSFAGELHSRGYQVTASDTSPKMIEIAKRHLGKSVAFHVGDSKSVVSGKRAPFSLVTAVMVFQFIENIDDVINDLDAVLCPNGVIAFAVFNPDFIQTNIGKNCLFMQTAKRSRKASTFMTVEGASIPVYPRSEHDYHAVLKARGYSHVMCRKPRFTRDFLEKYPIPDNTRFSEYLIMVYQKKHK